MQIFVGNLSFASTDAEVKELFEGFGSVASVVIIKEKNGVKSRGFGFVEMSLDQEAQAAIAALDGKEFMGRPLNVSPVRPKTQNESRADEVKNMQAKINVKTEAYPEEHFQQEKTQKDNRFSPISNKTGGYKRGRRSLSFLKKRAAAGIIEEEIKPRIKSHENPMRWRKRQGQDKPWHKGRSTPEPGQRTEGEHKPERRIEGAFMPWKKSAGGSKPLRKSDARKYHSSFKSRKRPGGYKRGVG
ncbi:MAG: hypothetical protein Q8L26_02250 [Candidatus Omnitrophota bacterium]|nr:hypothetical protein [Candidatus Omnitrophota bacterium]